MTANVGTTDKLVRIGIAVVAVAGALFLGLTSVAGIVLLVVAAIALLTALMSWCALYQIFGISTRPTPHS